MSIEFSINGETFHVGEYDKGWSWWTYKDEAEGYFLSALEAQQDAMNYVAKLEAAKKAAEEEAEDDRLQLIDEGKYFNPKGGNPNGNRDEY